MTEALDTALAIVRDLKLPVFPCVETPDEKGKFLNAHTSRRFQVSFAGL